MSYRKASDPCYNRNMKIRWSGMLGGLIAWIVIHDVRAGNSVIKPEQLGMVRALQKQGLLRTVGCERFTDWILKRSGLPPIGGNQPVKGRRKDMNRKRERETPPVLEDSVVRAEKPFDLVKVETRTGATQGDWELMITRLFDPENGKDRIREETAFVFRIRPIGNLPACELESLLVKARPDVESPPANEVFQQELGASDCLTLTRANRPERFFPAGAQSFLIRHIAEDCKAGLPYFHAFKQALEQIPASEPSPSRIKHSPR